MSEAEDSRIRNLGPEFWRVIQTVSESEDLSPDGMLVLEAGEDIE